MRKILVIGAGKSSSSLITYLLEKSTSENLHITVADISLELAKSKINNHKNGTAISLDISNDIQRTKEIALMFDHSPQFRQISISALLLNTWFLNEE